MKLLTESRRVYKPDPVDAAFRALKREEGQGRRLAFMKAIGLDPQDIHHVGRCHWTVLAAASTTVSMSLLRCYYV